MDGTMAQGVANVNGPSRQVRLTAAESLRERDAAKAARRRKDAHDGSEPVAAAAPGRMWLTSDVGRDRMILGTTETRTPHDEIVPSRHA